MTELPDLEQVTKQPFRQMPHLLGAEGSVDLRELIRKLWRRRYVLVGTSVIVTALAAIISFQITPRYTATASVMLEPRESQIVDVEAVLSGLGAEDTTINSEVYVLQSRQLALRVIERLKLNEEPEFNPALRDPSFWSGWFDYRNYVPDSWLPETRSRSEAETAMRAQSKIIEAFHKNLTTVLKPRSLVIGLSFQSESPDLAARITNALADLYIVEQLEAKFEAARIAATWLGSRLADLRRDLDISEKAVEGYRGKMGLVEGKDSVNVVVEQLSGLSTQLVVSRSQRAEAEARLNQVKRLLKSRRGTSSVAEVLSSGLIQNLLQQESELIRRSAELTSEYGPKHPLMINVRAEIRDLRAKIKFEVDKIIQGLRSEVEIAKAREASLRSSLRSLESRIGILNQQEIQLRALERDAEANRTLYDTFLTRFKEMSGQQELQTPDARIISRAGVPLVPSYPRKKLIIAAAFVASIFLGLTIVFTIEQLDSGFRSMDQIEKVAHVTALGLIPSLKRTAERGMRPENVVLDQPVSVYSESLRNLYVSLMLSNVDKPPKSVLITSSLPEEGKTTMASSLARTVAISGRKVLIIDCDLRKPSIHEKLGLTRSPGLVELLSHRADLKDVLNKDEQSGAFVITAGEPVSNTTDLLGSDQMKQLLSDMCESYEFVILDSSPLLAVSDARVLSTIVDTTAFVIQWERTRRELALHGLSLLNPIRGSIAGAILSNVDIKKHGGYSFGDSGYYHAKYAKYYNG